MLRGPLSNTNYKPQFSGHETFPLRYGWLKKAYDAVAETECLGDNRSVFSGDDAIARFGVGKNMVLSIRHWAIVSGIMAEKKKNSGYITTEFGRLLFDETRGKDPYLESPITLWLIHWNLCGSPVKTTWYWAFNYFNGATFERESFVNGLTKIASDNEWARVARATIKRDVECFVRSYVQRLASGRVGHEDSLESPLVELGLIRPVGKRDGFRFVRGDKPTLGNGVLVYALLDFWSQFTDAETLSFESILYEPGSPGRVFLIDEETLADRLLNIEDITSGSCRWNDTAGLRQIIRHKPMSASRCPCSDRF